MRFCCRFEADLSLLGLFWGPLTPPLVRRGPFFVAHSRSPNRAPLGDRTSRSFCVPFGCFVARFLALWLSFNSQWSPFVHLLVPWATPFGVMRCSNQLAALAGPLIVRVTVIVTRMPLCFQFISRICISVQLMYC